MTLAPLSHPSASDKMTDSFKQAMSVGGRVFPGRPSLGKDKGFSLASLSPTSGSGFNRAPYDSQTEKCDSEVPMGMHLANLPKPNGYSYAPGTTQPISKDSSALRKPPLGATSSALRTDRTDNKNF